MKQFFLTKRLFWGIIFCMKFKDSWGVSLTVAAIVSALGVCSYVTPGAASDRPVVSSPVSEYRVVPLEYRTDTVIVNDENFNNVLRHAAAGLFLPGENKIVMNYFKAGSEQDKIRYFCEANNRVAQLTLRHEKEHARKAHLIQIGRNQASPLTRGEVVIVNEIVAPAAEIIEAIDYHYKTGKAFPVSRQQQRLADEKISALPSTMNYVIPVDFSNQAVADIVLECALDHFKSSFNRGFYHSTVARAVKKRQRLCKTINSACTTVEPGIFVPDASLWAPVWSFETLRGPVNLWTSASPEMRKKVMQDIKNMVLSVVQKAGQSILKTKNEKTA